MLLQTKTKVDIQYVVNVLMNTNNRLCLITMNHCVGIVLNVRLWMGGLMTLMKGTIFWKTRVTWLLDINGMHDTFLHKLAFLLHYN